MIWKSVLAAVLIAMTSSAASAQVVETAATPKGDTQSWLTIDDYPSAALRGGEQGTVRALLTIDSSGKATACAVVRSSSSALLDSTACSIARRRARFKPATDKSGTPVGDVWLFSYTWILPPR